MNRFILYTFLLFGVFFSCGQPKYDLVIRNATIVDGSGNQRMIGDVAIQGDTIAAVGKNLPQGLKEIQAEKKILAPGFINMLSWATESLIEDGRGMSDLLQGVTLEVMGEGWSMGPLNEKMKKDMINGQNNIHYEIEWTTLGEYLNFLEKKGVGPNVASFVGATTLRMHELGQEDRAPSGEEMKHMQELARQAMEEGALGLGSSLIYAPAFYADTEELIQLCQAISEYNGMYITHMRSEGNQIIASVNEVLEIATKGNIQAEIYHLKAAGAKNWHKIDDVISKIDSAQKAGIKIAANMYNYVAGATGLDASMPPWVQEGGYEAWSKRLQDPIIRKQVIEEMKVDANDWENLYASAGDADKLILVDFKNPKLRAYTGKSLGEVAKILGKSPEETAIDLVIEDGSRVGTVYFLMLEENVKKQIQLPYMTFGSDAGAMAPEGVFLNSSTHPRAYGNFSRLLGKYVRDEKVIPLEEAIHKLTLMSAQRLKIKRRGLIQKGYFADLVLLDFDEVQDHATFAKPHQLATGVTDVWVNGVQAIVDGKHSGEFSGRFVKGPGYKE